jgi:hypothetical protein
MPLGEAPAMQTVQVGEQGEITLPPEIGQSLRAEGFEYVRIERCGNVVMVFPWCFPPASATRK